MFVIDSEEAFNDFNSMLASGEAELLEINGNTARTKINGDVVSIEIQEEYLIKRIINGKNSNKNIVNISIKDNSVFIFYEHPYEHSVSYDQLPYRHWVLSPKQLPGFKKLKGDQYYKYIQDYNSLDECAKIRASSYKLGLYSLSNFSEAYMLRYGATYFKGMKVSDVSALSFDIETTGLNPDADDSCVLLITNTYRNKDIIVRKTFNIEDYECQQEMIADWSNWVMEMNPSLLIGHNIIIFDLPYIYKQMEKLNQPLVLGRHNYPIEIEERTRELRKDGSQTYTYHRINIFGREIIDTFFLAIKADIGRKYESYGLKAIIKHEGLEKKDRVFYDASRIKHDWSDPEKRKQIIQYAEDDSDDALKLYDLMIAPFFYLTPYIPKTFQNMIESATGSQLNSMMVRSYLQDDYSVAKSTEVEPYEGAISIGCPGIYNDVAKVDVASLYPSIMREYKIFPKDKDFNNNFLKILDYFTIERLKNKKMAKETGDRYYKDLEQSQKVVINSAYGFMGADGLNYNYGPGAALVTQYGREVLTNSIIWATGHTVKKVIKKITNKGKPNEEIEYEWVVDDRVAEGRGFKLVNADTDSISITNGNSITEEDQRSILKDLNANYPNLIRFENDGYFQKVIVLKAKNYILFDGKKLKIKGSSLKDQKKEPALKEMLDKMINCLVFETPDKAIDIYNSYIKQCYNVNNISRWAAKKTITKAILKCADDPTIRKNEMVIYDAIRDIKVQEGDKVYLYPAILDQTIETKTYKNGNVKEKIIKTTGLKRTQVWNNDHDVDKLVNRVYETTSILSNVLDMSKFTDYTLKKNKNKLLDLLAS